MNIPHGYIECLCHGRRKPRYVKRCPTCAGAAGRKDNEHLLADRAVHKGRPTAYNHFSYSPPGS